MLERYGIGRASLREALRILEIYGVIRLKPGSRGGPIVMDMTSRDFGRTTSFFFHATRATFGDLLDARLSLEPMVASLAAKNITDQGREALQQSLDDHQSGNTPNQPWGYAAAEFHYVINGLSGNPILDLMCRSLLDIQYTRGPDQVSQNEAGESFRAHERIAQAIMVGDAEVARRRMRRHLETQISQARENRPDMLERLIDWR